MGIESASQTERDNLLSGNNLDEVFRAEEWSLSLSLMGSVRIISSRLAGNYSGHYVPASQQRHCHAGTPRLLSQHLNVQS